MPRIRTIKPEFPQSRSIGRVSRDARLLFLQLFTLADDEGRLRGTPELLAGLLYPYDRDDAIVDGIIAWLAELEREECVVCYSVGTHDYVQITNWDDHQKIDRPTKSRFPAPSRALASPREPSRALVVGSGSKDLDQDQIKNVDQDPGLTAGPPVCGNVENSTPARHVRVVRDAGPPKPRQIALVAADLVARDPSLVDSLSDLTEDTKIRCARMGLPYDATAVRQGIDAMLHQRARPRGGGWSQLSACAGS